MRASRILNLLLILQRQGRTSAVELARQLEVSERTIRRDVEALGQAGVPIYAAQGYCGGIELTRGFATHLTGLTDDEAQVLFLVGQPLVARRLGLAAPVRQARDKLLAALDDGSARRAVALSSWFVHDPDPWGGNDIPHGELRRLADCIHRRRIIELVLGDEPALSIAPLGLVLKAGSWFAACAHADGASALCLDGLRATRVTRQPFDPPPEFDLARFWSTHRSSGRGDRSATIWPAP